MKEVHTHTIVKYKGRKGFYRCNGPRCTYTAPKEEVIGKFTRCNACQTEFILDRETAKLAFPKCLNCRSSKKAKLKQAADRLLKTLLPSEADEADLKKLRLVKVAEAAAEVQVEDEDYKEEYDVIE